jgi:hypothetical protein
MASEKHAREPMREVDGWVVVTRFGYPFANCAARTRREAMCRYCDDDGAGFKLDQKRFGLRVERMTIVPQEAPDA